MKRFQGVDGRVWCSSGPPPAGPVVAEDAMQAKGLRPARPWVHLQGRESFAVGRAHISALQRGGAGRGRGEPGRPAVPGCWHLAESGGGGSPQIESEA